MLPPPPLMRDWRAAAGLLLVVFGLKAAVLPLYYWLPAAYANASAPVAALFALLTKVGVYSIIRVCSRFGPEFTGWLLPLGLATLLCRSMGVLASGGCAG